MKYLISIGIIDYADYRAKNSSNLNNYVRYSSIGEKYPQNTFEGNGFKIGDFVTVTVNRKTKTVKYFVNDKLEATQNADFLADQNRKLFPYANMLRIGDVI